jgi:hypothetical protein
MVTSLPDVVAEIKRSVSRLTASQHIGIILFRDRGDPALPLTDSFMPRLVRATPGARDRLAGWLAAAQPGGKSNPLDGLRAALALKPDAIFLLSRSIERSAGGVWQLNRDDTLRELERLNPIDPTSGNRAVTIKTVQFIEDDPTGIMQAIGEAHGTARPTDAPLLSGKSDPGYILIRTNSDLAKAPK